MLSDASPRFLCDCMSKKKGSRETHDTLASLRAQLVKDFGTEAIVSNKVEPDDDSNYVSVGSIAIHHALCRPGLRLGRIVEIYGPESSGKTTLALHVIASAQARGLNCGFIDAEHALDPVYASAVGVDMSKLLLSQPDYGEQGLQIVERLVSSDQVKVIVVDSVAALTPKAELEGEIGDNHVGRQARMMGQALRKLTGIAKKNGCLLIFINQLRMKIGVMFGSPETTPGGNALKFYSSVRLDVRRIGQEKDGDDVVGNKTRVRVKKNKLGAPFREAEFVITYGIGIDHYIEVFKLGLEKGLVTQAGAWFSIGKNKLGHGAVTAIAKLRTPAWKDRFETLEAAVVSAYSAK